MAKAKAGKTGKTTGRKASSSRSGKSKGVGSTPTAATKTKKATPKKAKATPKKAKATPKKAAPKKKAPAVKVRPRPEPISERERVLRAMERVQDLLQREVGGRVTLDMTTPDPGRGRTPWAVMARFKGLGGVPYERMAEVLTSLEESSAIEKAIGERTYARLVVTYSGPKVWGRPGRTQRDWTIGEIAPWGVTAARAANKVARAAPRYRSSEIVGVKMWISTDAAADFVDDGDDDGDDE